MPEDRGAVSEEERIVVLLRIEKVRVKKVNFKKTNKTK